MNIGKKIEVFAKALCVDPTFFVVDNMDISENYVKTSIKKMPVIGKIAAGYGGAFVCAIQTYRHYFICAFW